MSSRIKPLTKDERENYRYLIFRDLCIVHTGTHLSDSYSDLKDKHVELRLLYIDMRRQQREYRTKYLETLQKLNELRDSLQKPFPEVEEF